LLDFFIQMNKSGFFHGFEQVMTYGGSMGGYGALAYADAVNAGVVLSINPQATLSERLAPWETRFSQGKNSSGKGRLPMLPRASGRSARHTLCTILFYRWMRGKLNY